MSKMREEFEKFAQSVEFVTEQSAFEAGYQAAIAAVKGGGPATCLMRNRISICECTVNKLYKLPEDV